MVLFWLLVALLASLLALGPRLKLTPTHIVNLPLPYDPLTKLPVFTAGRRPQLFYFVAMLAFGVLLAFALREIFGWVGRRLPNGSVVHTVSRGSARYRVRSWGSHLR